jgi:ribosome-associated protein
MEDARQFAIDAARLAAHTHCGNVKVLDVSGVSPVTDFFVIATGTSPRQMHTVCDEIEELGEPRNYKPLAKPGYGGDHWILVDFFDVVVHVFDAEARLFYDLDNLWGDGKIVEWQDAERDKVTR